jgi:alpha-1,2-mannosyltransferase
VLTSSIISISRIVALYQYYHAPLGIAFEFQITEIPRLLNVTGLLPVYPEGTLEEDTPRIDLTPIKELELTLCLGKEWHRFSGNYLVPNGIKVEFIKSEFDGMLPRHFEERLTAADQVAGTENTLVQLSKKWWIRPQTTYIPQDLNDLNKEDLSHYVSFPYHMNNSFRRFSPLLPFI